MSSNVRLPPLRCTTISLPNWKVPPAASKMICRRSVSPVGMALPKKKLPSVDETPHVTSPAASPPMPPAPIHTLVDDVPARNTTGEFISSAGTSPLFCRIERTIAAGVCTSSRRCAAIRVSTWLLTSRVTTVRTDCASLDCGTLISSRVT